MTSLPERARQLAAATCMNLEYDGDGIMLSNQEQIELALLQFGAECLEYSADAYHPRNAAIARAAELRKAAEKDGPQPVDRGPDQGNKI